MITFRSCLVRGLLGLLLLTAVDVSAQTFRNGHPFDAKRFNLGFLMGFTYNSYNVKEQVDITDVLNGQELYLERIELLSKPGLNLGMIANLNLNKRFSLRMIPTISLEQRDFAFEFRGEDAPDIRKVEAAYLNTPLLLQIKTGYYKSSRVYVLAGGQWGYNLVSDRRVRDDPSLIKINRQDIALVFGFGITLYGDRLKLSPEIVYKMGLVDIYEPGNTSHSAAISSMMSQVISLNINFE